MQIRKFEFNMFPVNCYVIHDETKEAVIIDPGCLYNEEKGLLKDYIRSNELKIKHQLCTHLHLDHIFGCKFVKETYGVGVEANPADEFWIAKAPQQAQMFGFNLPDAPEPIEKKLFDGDKIHFGNTELEVISVPGHSPGCVAFYCSKDAVLFSGDILFQGSVGRADLEGGNLDDLLRNIRHKLFVLPADTTVYPGHGAPTTIGYEERHNPFFI